jgi:hypothetical protein
VTNSSIVLWREQVTFQFKEIIIMSALH